MQDIIYKENDSPNESLRDFLETLSDEELDTLYQIEFYRIKKQRGIN